MITRASVDFDLTALPQALDQIVDCIPFALLVVIDAIDDPSACFSGQTGSSIGAVVGNHYDLE